MADEAATDAAAKANVDDEAAADASSKANATDVNGGRIWNYLKPIKFEFNLTMDKQFSPDNREKVTIPRLDFSSITAKRKQDPLPP